MTPGTLVLIGLGLGALLLAKQSNPHEDPRATALDQLRTRAIEAQRASAIAAKRARELTAQWQEQCGQHARSQAKASIHAHGAGS